MSIIQNYLAKRKYKIQQLSTINPDAKFIVVIPAYDEPNILLTLESLWATKRISSKVEIIILANHPENCSSEIYTRSQDMIAKTTQWIDNHSDDNQLFFNILHYILPKKDAGVGLARKIGMDHAVERLQEKENGFIIGLDADTLVDENYFQAIEHFVQVNTKIAGFTICFSHQTSTDKKQQNYIDWYEIHLHYYREALKNTGFPHYFHTVGSAFGVKAEAYAKIGGMSKRKAGEDFYFLHKLAQFGPVLELTTTSIHPESRCSERVPFGTGAQITSLNNTEAEQLLTYSPEAFEILKSFFSQTKQLFAAPKAQMNSIISKQDKALQLFLNQTNFNSHIDEINKKSTKSKVFERHFFAWFDGFRVMKFLNFYSRLPQNKKINVIEAVNIFFPKTNGMSQQQILDYLRSKNCA